MNLGKQIYLLRLKKSISPEEMAEVLGVSTQMVSGWEQGAVLPETRFLPSMATLFGVTIDELFGFSDDELLKRMENTDWNAAWTISPLTATRIIWSESVLSIPIMPGSG